ncbi:hypothetical protein [Photobacterium damselae]|uniref:hypothetical protein n=1 Tax=Photobacterium damselae TaxID=38293 RepID=UPI001F2CCDE7|nr:hypothetical protein [Photobacterium damselae]UKA04912.1 hypothetical protein IHC89_21955 [Photobacterium damselae subsp. damselae]
MFNFAGEKLSAQQSQATKEFVDLNLERLKNKKGWDLKNNEYCVIFIINDYVHCYLLPIQGEFIGDGSMEDSFHNMINVIGGAAIRLYGEKVLLKPDFHESCRLIVKDVVDMHMEYGSLPTASMHTILSALVASCVTRYRDRIVFEHEKHVVFINCPLGDWL